jgi:hypothetical protein
MMLPRLILKVVPFLADVAGCPLLSYPLRRDATPF